jgi:hypothetical protein
MQFVKPMPFEEAVGKLEQKAVVTSGLSSSEWKDFPVSLRDRAFFSSRIESARFLQRARGAIADFLQGAREGTPSDWKGNEGSEAVSSQRAIRFPAMKLIRLEGGG